MDISILHAKDLLRASIIHLKLFPPVRDDDLHGIVKQGCKFDRAVGEFLSLDPVAREGISQKDSEIFQPQTLMVDNNSLRCQRGGC